MDAHPLGLADSNTESLIPSVFTACDRRNLLSAVENRPGKGTVGGSVSRRGARTAVPGKLGATVSGS